MRIAILGDSHIAALKIEWDQIAAKYPQWQVRFFAQRRGGMRDIAVEGPRLVATTETLRAAFRFTSGGLKEVDTRNYDAILVYGMKTRPFFWDDRPYYSQQATETALADTFSGTLAATTLDKLCQTGAGPIFVGHNPLPPARTAETPQDLTYYHAGLELINARVYAPRGAELVPQPAATITGRFHTEARFTSGATRLAIGEPNDDEIQPLNDPYHHMNATFGALWLETLFNRPNGPGA